MEAREKPEPKAAKKPSRRPTTRAGRAAKQGKAGRPPIISEVTDEMREAICDWIAYGFTLDQIAYLFGRQFGYQVSSDTIRYTFKDEVQHGLAHFTGQIAEGLKMRAKAGDVQASTFFLQMRSQWRKPPEQVEAKVDVSLEAKTKLADAILQAITKSATPEGGLQA